MFGLDEGWQVRRMASALGVDLAAAAVEGYVTRADFAALGDRCRQCSATARCAVLAASARLARHLPPACANRDELQQIAGA